MTANHDQADILFMKRAMDLARLGQGNVSPNPMVGSVIVHGGKIVGEGYHQQFGQGHAEVNAINSVHDRSILSESTIYVTLEPCAHFGKTPPCADMLVREKIKRVVISNQDPNPLVAGKGIEKLKNAGITVTIGVLEGEGEELNKRFFMMIREQRPYIILKWAQTADGFIARSNGDSKWISHIYSRQLTHKWRTEEDAILVGARTAAADNPRLTARDWTGRSPLRVVIDPSGRLESSRYVFDGTVPTIRYTTSTTPEITGVTTVQLEEDALIVNLVRDLHERKVQSLIVEGGSFTLNTFINAGLWDEARVFESRQVFGDGVEAPRLALPFGQTEIMNDTLRIYRRSKIL